MVIEERAFSMQTNLRFSRWLITALMAAVLIFAGCSSDDTPATPRTPAFTAAEIYAQIIAPQDENDQVLGDLLAADMDTFAAMDSVLVLFLENPAVDWGEVGPQGIAVSYKNGMVGGIFLAPEDHPEIDPEFQEPVQPYRPASKSNQAKATAKKAIFLNPHYQDRVYYADRIIQVYQNRLESAEYDELEVYKDSEATLDMFTELTGHRIVHIYSHGWAWPTKTNIQEVYLLSGEGWSVATYDKYWEEIEDGKIPLVRYHQRGDVFFVSPAFIYKHNNLDDDTLFYGGFCYSFLGSWPQTMAVDEGVGGYFGFDWSVLTAWNAVWNRNCIWTLLDNEANPRNNVNDWLTSDYPKWYQFENRVVHINYLGNQSLILFDTEEIPCSETAQTHDDVYVHATVTVQYGGVPTAEVPVRIDYQKIHCDGHLGSVAPIYGETGSTGTYVANTTGIFRLDNTQDQIVVKATVGGVVQQKIFPFGVFYGLDGSNLFFPMEASFLFNF